MGNDVNNPFSIPASADLSASQYCGVKIDSSGNLALPSAGGAIVGVLYTKPNALGRAGTVYGVGTGIRKLKYGGTITAGDVLKVGSDGKFSTASGPDIAAGAGVAVATVSGSSGDVGAGLLFGGAGSETLVSGDETVTTGALSAYADVSYLSISGTKAYTLPDGLYNGQSKRIECSVAGSTPVGTLTITTPFTSEQATYVFDTVGQAIIVVWRAATGWHIIGKRRAGFRASAIVMGTDNLAASDLHLYHNLSITGSQTSSLADGNIAGERIYFDVTVAASTPKGILTGSMQTKLGVTSASWGVTGTEITSTSALVGLEWTGAKWREVLATAVAAFA